MKRIIPPFFIFIALISCQPRNNKQDNSKILPSFTDTVKYAHGFNITQAGNIKILRIFNPWEGAHGIEFKYILCPRGQQIPDSLRNTKIIYTPVSRIICLSTTHVAMLSFLGKVNTLVGVASPNFVNDSLTRKMISAGQVTDIGYDQALNYEAIVALKPDIVMAYGVHGETATQYKKLEDLGINVVLNGEYLETSPLGKLEWVKFLASFYNMADVADKKFSSIEKKYLQLSELCNKIKDKPKVMIGLPWKGAWYVPGGDSYIAQLIDKAGGNYLWKDINGHESVPLNFEKVIERAGQADIWLNTGSANSLKDIQSEDSRLNNIKPFINKATFNNNARTNPAGGNDFWESGVTHPEIILKDLIKILHPELLPDYSLVYYKKLN
ncbi:MAG: ABC transporter substrate-binding protein [Bacteroidota bacterium]|nr:ABC transporter substrate-binding protein [Bacteroidota bacterium]